MIRRSLRLVSTVLVAGILGAGVMAFTGAMVRPDVMRSVLAVSPSHSLHITTTCSAGTCTTSGPSSVPSPLPAVGAWFLLSDVMSWRSYVCAASGQTLSGAGTIQWYVYANSASLAGPSPYVYQTIPAGCAGARCCFMPNAPTTMRFGDWALPVPNGITVSGGATLDVYVDGWTASGT